MEGKIQVKDHERQMFWEKLKDCISSFDVRNQVMGDLNTMNKVEGEYVNGGMRYSVYERIWLTAIGAIC